MKKLEEAIKLKDDEIKDIHTLMEIKNKSNKDHFNDIRKNLDKFYQQSKERLMSHQALAQKVNEMELEFGDAITSFKSDQTARMNEVESKVE